MYEGIAVSMAEKNKITLSIGGKNYTLVHDETDDYMKRIEHYLNAKIETAGKAGIQLGEQTALIMASISVIDELFKTQKNFNTLKNEIRRIMDEYDKLKAEKILLEETLADADKKIESLSSQLIERK